MKPERFAMWLETMATLPGDDRHRPRNYSFPSWHHRWLAAAWNHPAAMTRALAPVALAFALVAAVALWA